MKVVRTDFAELVQLSFEGRLDAAWSEPAAQELEAAIRLGRPRIEVDLAQVAFVSSVGIGVLLRAVSRFRAVGGTLVVVDASDEVRRMFRVSKLDAVLLGERATARAPATEGTYVEIGDGWSGTAILLDDRGGQARDVWVQPGAADAIEVPTCPCASARAGRSVAGSPCR